MTERFYKYGIHAEVNDSGELFLNATAVTLSRVAANEFGEWLSTSLVLHTELDELGQLTFQEQSEVDADNDVAYRAGLSPLETNLEILAQQEPGIEQVSEEQFTAEVDALNGVEEVLEVVPTEGFDDTELKPPPRKGPGSGADAWRAYAAAVTDSPLSAWANLKAVDIQATLQSEGVL